MRAKEEGSIKAPGSSGEKLTGEKVGTRSASHRRLERSFLGNIKKNQVPLDTLLSKRNGSPTIG